MAKNKSKKQEEVMEETEVGATQEVKEVKKNKKLGKGINGSVVTLTEGVTGTVMEFDFNALPSGIQEKFGPFGLGHKLGDAAAGKSGQDAIDAINKVYDGLMKNDWSIRAPAAPKVTKAEINANLNAMSPDEKEAAMALLARLGLKI
jgi:hypothetical protein